MTKDDALFYAAVGAAYILGAAVCLLVMRDRIDRKYRKIADEEIESVKKAYRRDKEETPAGTPKEDDTTETEEYRVTEAKIPVVIPPEEFGENEEYDACAITYYEESETFADDADEPLTRDEWTRMLGAGVVSRFGEYEPDRVCVRNDAEKRYYEILRDEGEYMA